jgi:hypothetical protein
MIDAAPAAATRAGTVDAEALAVLVTAIVLVALLTFLPLSSNDFWLQVTIGGMIWNDGAIPGTVLFPFTEAKDYPFIAHEWLPSVIVYLLHRWLGYDQLLFVKGVFGFAMFALCYRLAERLTRDAIVATLLAVLAMVVGNYRHFLRPEIFAMVFLLALLNLLVEYQLSGRKRVLVWALPLAALWANCHASFPIGLVIVGLFGAGAAIDCWRGSPGAPRVQLTRAAAGAATPYFVLALGMALATLLNPYGYHLYAFAWRISQWEVLPQFIIEWRPTFADPFVGNRAFWAYLVYLAAGLAVGIAYRKRLNATAVLLFVAFAILATQRQRHIVLFAYIGLYCLAATIGALAWREHARRFLAMAVTAVLGIGIAAVLRYGNMYGAWPYSVSNDNFTPPMEQFIRDNRLEGNVYNSYTLGAQLIHDFYPRLRPIIDSRIDAYGEPYFLYTEHLGVDEQAMLQFIERYDVRYFLLTWEEFRDRISTMPKLRADGWRIIFADHKALLLAREAQPVR